MVEIMHFVALRGRESELWESVITLHFWTTMDPLTLTKDIVDITIGSANAEKWFIIQNFECLLLFRLLRF